MQPDIFDLKWDSRCEHGHYGLAINDPEVITLVDETFTLWEQLYPDFTFSQIKTKFNSVRVYCENVPYELTRELEQKIEQIIKNNEQ
jgi:hypothetical protein